MNLPPIGFGCSPIRHGDRGSAIETAVRTALSAGYRLFDLAEVYGNERTVGRALRQAPAAQVFVVGKVWRTNFRPPALRAACESSLQRLGRDAFDLYLLHAPEAWQHVGPLLDPETIGEQEFTRRALPRDDAGQPRTDNVPLAETWGAMRDLVRRGVVGAVGVSNFEPRHLETLPGLPAANQIASSPCQDSRATVAWCRERGIRLLSHSPLSVPGLLAEPLLHDLATRYRRSVALIVLRWLLQRGLVPLPSSTDPEHIRENLQVLDFELDQAAMAAVDSLADRGQPTTAPLA